MSTDKMKELLQKQVENTFNARQMAWQPVMERRDAMLASFGGKSENAPASVHQQIAKEQKAFEKEWGQDGTAMKDLKAVHKQQQKDLITEQIRSSMDRNRDKDNGR